MDSAVMNKLLAEQINTLDAAVRVLQDSHQRVGDIFKKNKSELSVAEKESCEALTARFARLCDFLFQRAFRTLDQVELMDEGSGIDRLNRMEKRGVIASATLWRNLRELRNDIAHEYLIERSDHVLKEAYQYGPELLRTVEAFKKYLDSKGYGQWSSEKI